MKRETVDKILSMDIRVLTNEGNDKVIRFTDFKNLKDMTISYEYDYSHVYPVLDEIKIDVKCNGYLLAILDTESKSCETQSYTDGL